MQEELASDPEAHVQAAQTVNPKFEHKAGSQTQDYRGTGSAAPVRKVRMFSRERERQRQATVQARKPSAASASAAAMAERCTKRCVRSRMAGRT